MRKQSEELAKQRVFWQRSTWLRRIFSSTSAYMEIKIIILLFGYCFHQMISKFSIISLLALAVFALHIDHQELNVTAATSLDQVITDLTAFNHSVYANTAYSEKITDNKDFSDFLKRALEREMADLYVAQASMIPTIAITPSTCSDLNDTQRAELIKKLECAQGKLMNLTKYLENFKNATVQQELYRRTSLQYLYVQQIKKGIQNSCSQSSKIAASSMFYNLAAHNWIFGATATKQDIAKLYTNVASHGTVTVCDISTPFIKLGTSQCFACPSANPIFDLTQQACTRCPGNSTYNNNSHRCECDCNCSINVDGNCIPKPVVYTNGNYLNLAGSTSNSISRYTEAIKQYVSDSKVVTGQCAQDENSRVTECVKCKAGQYFLVDTYTCTTCPNFDVTSKLCNGPTGTSTSTSTSNNPIVVNPSVTSPSSTEPSVTQQPTIIQPTTTEPQVVTTTTTTVTEGSTNPTSSSGTPVEFTNSPPSTSSTSSTTSTSTTINYVDSPSTSGATSSTSNTASSTTLPRTVAPTVVSGSGTSSTTASSTGSSSAETTSNTWVSGTTTQYSGSNQNSLSLIFANNPNLIMFVNASEQCPSSTPFYTADSNNPCISCPSYFNWDTKKCGNCPFGTTFQNNVCI